MKALLATNRLLVTLIVAMMVAAVSFGADAYTAPQIELERPWIAILYAVVALAGILVVGFKNSKRTHLD